MAEQKPRGPSSFRRVIRALGPGVITGAADDDPSGIGTYSVAGAQFGYLLLWLTPLCIPLMIAVQEMCGRVGVVTGKGLAGVMKSHYPAWLLHGSIWLLLIANVFNIYADLNAMAASLQMLWGLPLWVWLIVITVTTIALQILVPYRQYVKVLKFLCLSLLSYAIVALLPSVHNDWGQILRHSFVPYWSGSGAFVLTVVGYFGTTISPYLFFWQASEEVEENVEAGLESEEERVEPASGTEMFKLRADTAVGMVFSQIATFFVVTCTAATLHNRGITDIETAQDAARALMPLGNSAHLIFTVGIIGVGLLAIPTLAGSAAYAVAESGGWPYGLYKPFGQAKRFYAVIAGTVLLGLALNFVHALSPVRGLLYSAALNGVVAPPLIVILLLVCNNRLILKERTNGWASNLFGGLCALVMGGSAIILIWTFLAKG